MANRFVQKSTDQKIYFLLKLSTHCDCIHVSYTHDESFGATISRSSAFSCYLLDRNKVSGVGGWHLRCGVCRTPIEATPAADVVCRSCRPVRNGTQFVRDVVALRTSVSFADHRQRVSVLKNTCSTTQTTHVGRQDESILWFATPRVADSR